MYPHTDKEWYISVYIIYTCTGKLIYSSLESRGSVMGGNASLIPRPIVHVYRNKAKGNERTRSNLKCTLLSEV